MLANKKKIIYYEIGIWNNIFFYLHIFCKLDFFFWLIFKHCKLILNIDAFAKISDVNFNMVFSVVVFK